MRIVRLLVSVLSLAFLIPLAFAFPAAAAMHATDWPDFRTIAFDLTPLDVIRLDELSRQVAALDVKYDGSPFIRFGERALLHDEFDGASYVIEVKIAA